MSLRKLYLSILLILISLQLEAQMLPMTGFPSQLLMRNNYPSNNMVPQGASNSSKRNVTYSSQQKKLRDSLITIRTNSGISDEIINQISHKANEYNIIIENEYHDTTKTRVVKK